MNCLRSGEWDSEAGRDELLLALPCNSLFSRKHSAAISGREFVHLSDKVFGVSLASEVVHQISLYPDRRGTLG